MPATLTQLGIDQWSAIDRWQLIEELFASFSDSDEVPQWHREIIDERLNYYDTNPNQSLTREQLDERLRATA